MKRQLIHLLVGFSMLNCGTDKSAVILYQSDEFVLYDDGVVQGDNQSKVISPSIIRSNYKSKKSENYSRRLQFKFSLNKRITNFLRERIIG